MTWYWAWCHGVRRPHGSDATLSTAALMLRNSESLVTVLGWHWLSSSPRLQRRCLIRGDHYPSPGFARLQERDPQKWCFFFFFLVTGLKRQQRVHCQAEQESSSSLPSSVSPDLKPHKKAAGSSYIIHCIINIIMISYCLIDLREDGWTDEWMRFINYT